LKRTGGRAAQGDNTNNRLKRKKELLRIINPRRQ